MTVADAVAVVAVAVVAVATGSNTSPPRGTLAKERLSKPPSFALVKKAIRHRFYRFVNQLRFTQETGLVGYFKRL